MRIYALQRQGAFQSVRCRGGAGAQAKAATGGFWERQGRSADFIGT